MNTLDQLLAALEFFSVGEFQNEVLDDQVRQAADMLYNQRRYGRETLNQGSLAVIYADHVTAQQQAELSALRTQAIADAAEIEQLRAEVERLKVGHDRYEIVRKLNAVQFQALYTKALQSHLPFDELVDMLGESK